MEFTLLLTFTSVNGNKIEYQCRGLLVGQDCRDLYIIHERVDTVGVAHEDKDLVARFFNDSWHPVDYHSLLYIDEAYFWKLAPSLDEMKYFEHGWRRGYDAGKEQTLARLS